MCEGNGGSRIPPGVPLEWFGVRRKPLRIRQLAQLRTRRATVAVGRRLPTVGTVWGLSERMRSKLRLAADCYKALLSFVAPKLRSIEVNAPIGHAVRVVEVATGICGAPGSAVDHRRSIHPGPLDA
jgi:hypothetical protein